MSYHMRASAGGLMTLLVLWIFHQIYSFIVGAKLQATNRVPRPVDRGTATRYGG